MLELATHVPRHLGKVLHSEYFVQIRHYGIRDFLGGYEVDIIHVDHQHRNHLAIQDQAKHARVYQARLKPTLYQGR